VCSLLRAKAVSSAFHIDGELKSLHGPEAQLLHLLLLEKRAHCTLCINFDTALQLKQTLSVVA